MDNSELFKRVTALIQSYVAGNNDPDGKVVEYLKPDDLKRELGICARKQSGTMDEVLKAIEKYLHYSVRTGHKHYFNQLWAGFSMPAFLGEVFSALTNNSMYTYEMSPVATLLEKHLIDRMCGFAGFEGGEGIFVTGGSNANLTAVLAARNDHFKNAKERGISTLAKQPVFFVSDQAHFSFLKAANISGIGMDNVPIF